MGRIYIAGSTSSVEKVRIIRDLVLKTGHIVTFDWTLTKEEGGEGEIRTTWQNEPGRAEELSSCERRAVERADVLIINIDKFIGGPGKWIEYGMAAARKIPIWIYHRGEYPEGRDSVFFYLPEVLAIDNEVDLEMYLEEMKEAEELEVARG